MALFDLVKKMPLYAGKTRDADRLNNRHKLIIDPFKWDLRGARILDLASHDGRWPYAFAKAGAREVIGIEGRPELIADFQNYPKDEAHARINLIQGDINTEVARMVDAGERFDVVGVLGIFYHITTHYQLLSEIRALQPKLILIDSEFMNSQDTIIRLINEDSRKHMNSLPAYDGQDMVVKGVPSRGAMEMMAESLGYKVEWLDWEKLPKKDRVGVADYYRPGPKTRATCALRPVA
ncbi:MAG: class I SAM-dependent methyltransferase [Pseudomonadota bacterium]